MRRTGNRVEESQQVGIPLGSTSQPQDIQRIAD